MNAQLDDQDAYHRVVLAQSKAHCDKEDPEYSETDGRIYKKIIQSSDDSDEEE